MLTLKYFLYAAFLLLPFVTTAQTDSLPTQPTVKKNVFTASINYQDKLNYFGRTDSLQSSGLFPSLGFELKNGLYAKGNFIFVQNDAISTTYTGTTIEAGYNFKEKKHFSGNIFYTHFLYKDNSQLVQSALKAQTGINATYKNKIINLIGGADVKFSDKADIGTTLGLDHLFIIKGKNKTAIAFNPAAYVYAGTQQFSNTYIKNNTVGGITLPSQQQVTESVVNFSILSYDFSMPVVLVFGKFNAYVSPAYTIPQNLIAGEKGANLFYVTTGLGVRL
jgi:hypothetical protein